MDLTEEEKELYERMKVDLEAVDLEEKLRVMQHLTQEQINGLYRKCMTDEEKALYLRARDNPASVTPAEKNQSFARMDPEEKDRLDAGSLTELEAVILNYGGDCDIDVPKARRRRFWIEDLPPEERDLALRVRNLLDYDYELAVKGKAKDRLRDLYRQENPQQKSARRSRKRQKLYPTQLAKWVQDILDAKTPRCGFVIFRTDYADGSDEKWQTFCFDDMSARSVHFTNHWKRANNLLWKFKSEYASDSPLEGLDARALRSRFKSMRDRGEISEGVASTCFLVTDEAVLNNAVIEGKIFFSAKTADQPNPWYDTLSIRAVNADYDGPAEGGEIVLPISKTFEWLYFYTTFTTGTSWEALYETAQEGPAEILVS
ncbi:hypothetical protein LQW54_011456 [Pestalotiopsis sp. IQ-011]